ncbi:hypothetical protein Ancab_004546, partial [Ancistrocladus abbreviatus]
CENSISREHGLSSYTLEDKGVLGKEELNDQQPELTLEAPLAHFLGDEEHSYNNPSIHLDDAKNLIVINDDECDDDYRRLPFKNRFLAFDGIALSSRVGEPVRRFDQPEPRKPHSYGTLNIGQTGERRDMGSSHTLRFDHENDQGQGNRVWDKGLTSIMLDMGPFERSLWKASRDEIAMEEILVAGKNSASYHA